MKLVFCLILVGLCGCVTVPPQPIDVSLIPNDCANQRAIVNYLERVAAVPASRFGDQQSYEQHISQAKNRMWHLRYFCNRG